MKTLTADVEVGTDGVLRLEIPTDLPAGPADVVLVVQPKIPKSATGSARSGVFVGRSVEGIDVDAALEQMNSHWRAKLGLGG